MFLFQYISQSLVTLLDPTSHLMLSYQWSSKILVVKIRDRLRAAGYKVWMDIDNLGK